MAGGYARYTGLTTVEVMNINTKQWTTICPLPQKLWYLSGVVCGDSLYLAGGNRGSFFCSWSKSVFICSLPDLSHPETLGFRIRRTLTRSKVWKEISSLPVSDPTLTSFSGHLLAIDGRDSSGKPTPDVYRYNSHTDSWHVISQMKNKRAKCFAVTLPKNRIIVVGGTFSRAINSVEILEDTLHDRVGVTSRHVGPTQ